MLKKLLLIGVACLAASSAVALDIERSIDSRAQAQTQSQTGSSVDRREKWELEREIRHEEREERIRILSEYESFLKDLKTTPEEERAVKQYLRVMLPPEVLKDSEKVKGYTAEVVYYIRRHGGLNPPEPLDDDGKITEFLKCYGYENVTAIDIDKVRAVMSQRGIQHVWDLIPSRQVWDFVRPARAEVAH